jgi:tetratricopeptide (TPR) repeat protein
VLDDLAAIAQSALASNGAVVLLTGEAGIGKTTVVQAAVGAVRDDFAVSWGACAADDGAPPFWPWRSLVSLDETNTRPPASGAALGAGRYEQLSALRHHVLAAASERPRLHVIEDLQWADVASVLLLSDLLASIAGVPLLVVVTMRTDETVPAQLDAAIDEVRRSARVHSLAPLDESEVRTLVRAAGADAASEGELARLVLERTGGNPLFATELLRAVTAAQAPDRQRQLLAGAVPDRVAGLVLRRLTRLPDAVADVLRTAAVLGAEGDDATLAAAVGTETTLVVDLLAQARAAHVLDPAPPGRWRFRHALVRDAVDVATTGSDRARRHARALDALAASAATPATLARHALAGLPIVDVERAVALAARAGETAFAGHAYEEAIVWFERALDATPATTLPRWRAELLVMAGEARRLTGAHEAARAAFVRAAALTDDPGLLARCALGYADPGADLGIAYRSQDAATADLLERAIAAQATLDTVTGVHLESRLAAELHFSDEPARARALAASAAERADRLGDDLARGLAGAVGHDGWVVGQADLRAQLAGSERLVAMARRSGSVAALLSAHRARVLDLLAAGDIAAMDAEVATFRRLAEPLRAPAYLWWPALWSAMRALLEGRHDEAEKRAAAAFALGEPSFPMLAFVNYSFMMFFLRREQGRLSELEQPVRDFAAANADVPAFRVPLAFLLAEQGKLDAATTALAAIDGDALGRLRDRNWPASWFQLARAAFLTGDRELATTLLEPVRRPTERCVQVSLATVCLGAADLATAWLLHATGDVEGADEYYRSAATTNARVGASTWLAQTRADHARLLLARGRDGDHAEAARLAELAETAARTIGLATLANGPAGPAGPAAPARATAGVAHPDTSRSEPAAAVLRRSAGWWEASFGGRTAQLADSRGLRDVAYLLARPGVAVSVLELAGGPNGAATMTRGAAALDDRARGEIRARLRDLDDDEAEAEAAGDHERAALARERRQRLAETVATDFGLAGRSRLIGDPVERARKTVSTRIRRTIATIARAHPELGRHLDRSIDTGTWCAYRPAEATTWST